MNFEFTNILFISTLVIPGIISMKTYDYHIANDRTKYSSTHLILEAIMFSVINMSLLLPVIIIFILTNKDVSRYIVENPLIFYGGYVFFFAFCPFAWTNVLVWGRKNLFKTPYKMAWDHYFSQEPVCFILVHLNDGSMIGGVFADKSKVNDYPNTNDIYIEEQWEVNDKGEFIGKVDFTDGIYIKSGEYKYIEFYKHAKRDKI